MAQHAVISLRRLVGELVLAPERYDPRRRLPHGAAATVGDVASFSDACREPGARPGPERLLVLDTGDARDGVLRPRAPPVSPAELRSRKRVLLPGDVVISRLRPYLRQVGLIDGALARDARGPLTLLGSTEFFVIRGRDRRSVAFLVPWLLRDDVQEVLAAAQEGGHHPRVERRTVETLALDEATLARRDEVSSRVVAAVRAVRRAEAALRRLSR